MAEPDELIHQPLRLKIMAGLSAAPDSEPVDFPRLKAITQATDGNLGSHLAALEKAGYVVMTKDFAGKRPRTRIALTPQGLTAFRRHVAYLRELVESFGGEA